ncbi:helix-turn-helix domain-containing protein [Streptosporangiaceae bacterium NEAU-GS5]|nr:helix-turn-helix domain-containing protein [Streptosporangiaceae bacterium NEAU-GS5]
MAHSQPTTYRELADVLNSIPLLLREARRARGLSQRATAEQLGMSFSTVCRIEDGRDGMVSNALAVLAWLDQTPEAGE